MAFAKIIKILRFLCHCKDKNYGVVGQGGAGCGFVPSLFPLPYETKNRLGQAQPIRYFYLDWGLFAVTHHFKIRKENGFSESRSIGVAFPLYSEPSESFNTLSPEPGEKSTSFKLIWNMYMGTVFSK